MVSTTRQFPAPVRTLRTRIRDHAAVTRTADELQTRSVFRELLELLSSREAQVQYEADVPVANVPAELLCMWFNDHYHPETVWFTEAFTSRERAALAAFDGFFSAVADGLPTEGGVTALHAESAWTGVCEKAAEALAALD